MAQPYVGEVRMFSFNFPPSGWAECNGQLLAIAQNQALYSILGTAYGGDGRTTFALPDLRGRTPLHREHETYLGNRGGEEYVTLTTDEIPAHSHAVHTRDIASKSSDPSGNLLAQASVYASAANLATMSYSSIGSAGGGQDHENMQPYLVINFCIALVGIFPPRN